MCMTYVTHDTCLLRITTIVVIGDRHVTRISSPSARDVSFFLIVKDRSRRTKGPFIRVFARSVNGPSRGLRCERSLD